MNKIFTGIIALVVPLFLFAQTAKEAQDIDQIRQKIHKVEMENARLRQQLSGIQKSLVKINEAGAKMQLDFLKQDSAAKAARDTVNSYSGSLLNMEMEIDKIKSDENQRFIGFLVFAILLILVIAILWWIHHKIHRRDQDVLLDKLKAQREERELRIAELKTSFEKSQNELLEKMKAQREEREKRIAELRNVLEQSGNELLAIKKETGNRFSAINDDLARVDKNLQNLLEERSHSLEQQIRDGFLRIKKEQDETGKEFLKKHENVQSLVHSFTSKLNDLGQKIADLGKKGEF